MGVKFPWQKNDETGATAAEGGHEADAADEAAAQAEKAERDPGYTPKKGHATPKRRDQELARGVIRGESMAPTTPAQARAERKKLKESMTKEEWKKHKRKEREANRSRQREAQARMDAGDERYLLERDRGEERRFVRDWVDARRFANNYVMPAALILLVFMLISNAAPKIAAAASLFAMALIVIFFIEGVWLGRRANAAVRDRFPGTSATGFGLGMYAYSRATQPRRWRTPRPRVELGADV